MAKEVGQFGINVNCLVPGAIDTDMLNKGVDGFAQSLGMDRQIVLDNALQNHIIKKSIDPKQIADFCVFLSSNEGAVFTGSILPIDNGYTC